MAIVPPAVVAKAVPAALINSSLPLQVTVGCLCASYWRGAWYIFDYTLFPHDRVKSSVTSLLLGSGLLGMHQFILSPAYNGSKLLVRLIPPPRNYSLRTYFVKMNRFINLYMIAISCVLVWRGAWLMWDEVSDRVSNAFLIEDNTDENAEKKEMEASKPLVPIQMEVMPTPEWGSLQAMSAVHQHANDHHRAAGSNKQHSEFWNMDAVVEHDAVSHHDLDRTLFLSGVASHVCATVGLLMFGRFKSVMAPPANVSIMKDIFLNGKGREFIREARSFSKLSS